MGQTGKRSGSEALREKRAQSTAQRGAEGALNTTALLAVLFGAAFIAAFNENIINVNRERLLATLKRMAVVAEKRAPIVKVDIEYNTMTLSSEDPAMSVKGSEKREVDNDGTGMRIGLKVPTMVETLSNIESENVEIRLKDERRAVLIQPSESGREDEPYEAVVMPYRIQ